MCVYSHASLCLCPEFPVLPAVGRNSAAGDDSPLAHRVLTAWPMAAGLMHLHPWVSNFCFPCWGGCHPERSSLPLRLQGVKELFLLQLHPNKTGCSFCLRQNFDKCPATVSFLWISYFQWNGPISWPTVSILAGWQRDVAHSLSWLPISVKEAGMHYHC